MQAFHSIESLRHVAEDVRSRQEYHASIGIVEPKPTITFHGTVKLHGTNGGVRVCGNEVIAQGRSRVLTIQNDNFGFAHFVAGRQDDFRRLALALAPASDDVTLYGEWCGTGIQKKVGIASLPKMFVVFAVYCNLTETFDDEVLRAAEDNDLTEWLNNQNIFLITQAPTFEITIDFENPVSAAEELSRLTLQVEEACPFANSQLFYAFNHGDNIGIGEGIVWVSNPNAYKRLTFKTKGEKHKKGGERQQVEIDPVKAADIAALVEVLLPTWRLDQGFDYLRENNIPMANTSTGEYLKWLAKDILKEEAAVIAANPYPWKDIQGKVMVVAKEYFFANLDEMAGLTSAADA